MKKIIVADDSALARSFIIKCIEISGLEDVTFIEASDGQEVLNRIDNEKPDLILTDLNMPNINGLELVKKIKEKPDNASIPIVVITSAGNTKEREEFTQLGVNGIASKPITPPKIAEILESIFHEGEDSYGTYY